MDSAPSLENQHPTRSRPGAAVITAGNVSLNLDTYDLRIDGRQVDLSRQEFDLLLLLLRHRDRVLPREAISQSLWQCNRDEGLLRLNTAVHRLRVKLAGSRPYGIRMVRRRGYGFCSITPTSGSQDVG